MSLKGMPLFILLIVVGISFTVGYTQAAKISKRESVSFWKYVLGIKRRVNTTIIEKLIYVLCGIVPLVTFIFLTKFYPQ